ncbi:nicotinate phosphoribosyltransferase isoform X2 [Phyllopteryx taeniolatus]|uniref:nicotinate phosphoribosyltransferase isoform X2 n=1 Tax=Phyllopteryx taeniolatus TaxID=161469 RepID=UPI002AD2F39D|nr:nicotinate phosphoribosyltransferase isoform X2 [Phyllopteryx taeniolatus]
MAAPCSTTCERSILERVPPLLTDLYQFTMAYAYWRAGRHQEHSVFELFFRENPFCGCFSLFAGLNDCLLFLRSFCFTDKDVDYLRSVLPTTTDPAFFQFLRSLDCSGVTLCSVPEGTVVFAREPLMEVAGPLAVVQLLETSLLCLVNYASDLCTFGWARISLAPAMPPWSSSAAATRESPAPTEAERPRGLHRIWWEGTSGPPLRRIVVACQQSLVCTNAARFRLASGPRRKLLEMGLRRAQGPDGGLTASKYSYIGGFDLTSNVQAGLLFGIPVAGTMAHSYVTSFTSMEEVWPQTLVDVNRDHEPVDFISLAKGWLGRVCELLGVEPERINEGELAAFLSYAIAYPQNFLPVIDSYSVTCSGLLNFCAVALALCELGYRPVGVRLDSGDLCKQSVDVRCALRLCSKHFSTSAFDSLIIVGTNNISEQTMVELNKKENEIDVVGVGTHLVTCTKQPSLGCVYKLVEVRGKPRMKISEDPEKSTLPGRKSVYRLIDAEGHPFLDLVCLALESPPEAGRHLRCHPLVGDGTPLSVTPVQVICLHQEVFTQGQVTHPLSSAAETKANVQGSLQSFHPRHKRLEEPDSYTVALSEKQYNLVTELRRHSSKKTNFILAN